MGSTMERGLWPHETIHSAKSSLLQHGGCGTEMNRGRGRLIKHHGLLLV